MTRQETHQTVATHTGAKRMSAVPDAYTPELAALYAKKMVQRRTKGWGDDTNAVDEVANWCGMSGRALKRLINGERKIVGLDTYGRIHRAYVNYCLRMIRQLKHEVEITEEVHGHAAVADIIGEVEALEARAEAALSVAKTERIRA